MEKFLSVFGREKKENRSDRGNKSEGKQGFDGILEEEKSIG